MNTRRPCPRLKLSSIKMDLFRRDFSINALAVRLDCEPFGQLVDFFGGQRDIKERVIRVLRHPELCGGTPAACGLCL